MSMAGPYTAQNRVLGTYTYRLVFDLHMLQASTRTPGSGLTMLLLCWQSSWCWLTDCCLPWTLAQNLWECLSSSFIGWLLKFIKRKNISCLANISLYGHEYDSLDFYWSVLIFINWKYVSCCFTGEGHCPCWTEGHRTRRLSQLLMRPFPAWMIWQKL